MPDARTCVLEIAARLERWKGHVEMLTALKEFPATGACGSQAPRRRTARPITSRCSAPSAPRAVSRIACSSSASGAVPALLQAADVHCQPNTAPEPFGLAFVEALYAGLPVVTMDMGGAAEVLTRVLACWCRRVTWGPSHRAPAADREPGCASPARRRRALARAGAMRSGTAAGTAGIGRGDGGGVSGRHISSSVRARRSGPVTTRFTPPSTPCLHGSPRRGHSRTSAAEQAASGNGCVAASSAASGWMPFASKDCRRTSSSAEPTSIWGPSCFDLRGRRGRCGRDDRASRESTSVRSGADADRASRQPRRCDDPESVECAQPADAGDQAPVLRVPGQFLSGASDGVTRNGSPADRGGIRSRGDRGSLHDAGTRAVVGRSLSEGARAGLPPTALGQCRPQCGKPAS